MAQKKSSAASATPDASKGAKRKREIDWDTISEDNGFGGFQLEAVKQTKKQKTNLPSPTKDYSRMPMDAVIAQANPFDATDLSDTFYKIVPKSHWEDAQFKRYAKFTVENDTYHVGDTVFIAADPNQNSPHAPIPTWAAKVLEIRGANANNVYLRVYWMYRPEDLEVGRQPYHGRNELIASNDMAILHARTVDGPAEVKAWKEDPTHEEVLDSETLFWRQTVDVTKNPPQLSELPKHCIDKAPWNPDEPLIQCASCQQWLHASCIEKAAVEKAYKSHNLAHPGEKARGKKGAKKTMVKPPSAFEAHVVVGLDGRTHMSLTDKRAGPTQNTTTEETVHCLFCGAAVDDASTRPADAAQGEASTTGIHVNSSLLTPTTPPNKDDEESEDGVQTDGIAESSPALVNDTQESGIPPTATQQTAAAVEASPPPSPFIQSALRKNVLSIKNLLTNKP
ncbi:hypothetical protein DM02DRAFT_154280 [Periconia macrospinosa]|uniref:BAH domain-containing protein n=1 Tax=Periconia macrospinosa TaxID=97972 RepID=A0A2V1ECU1_9PLEO|nr:hypothetical protein DM02DRAFT_154280 [Periconia macrospinosa]